MADTEVQTEQTAEATQATQESNTVAAGTQTGGTTEEDLRETIRNEVFDPELGLNVVDLGLIYDITVADNKADITMTLTTPYCPVGPELITNIRRSLSRYEDIEDVEIHVVFSPAWSPSMMSEEAKDELGYFG